jgi:hypothetical protein
MKKFAAIAALLASASFVAPASAATFIKGTILFGSNATTTAHSAPGLNANFEFVVDEPYTPGDPAIVTISDFKYSLGSNSNVAGIPTVAFFGAPSGMFQMSFGDHSIDIFGQDIGTGGSVIPGFYDRFQNGVITVGVNGTPFMGNGSLSATPTAVPEPETWAMMLAGFGAIGYAMRRRQHVRVSFA